MARWCFDPTASYHAGEIRFRRPYPRNDYGDDVKMNQWPLRAMRYAIEAEKILEKPGDEWDDRETKWYREYRKELKHARPTI